MSRYKFIHFLLTASLLFINSCNISSNSTSSVKLSEKMNKTYDIIIVPGCPFENEKWDRTMKGRIYWAKYLFDAGIARNIMFSGNAVYTPYYEAVIMALYAEAIGIPKEHIYTELLAEHSTENVYYSYKKAKKLGFNSIALASDPLQVKMLRSYIRKKINPELGLLPMIIDTLKAMEHKMIDPEIDCSKAFVSNFIPLTERQGKWKRFRGTMGKNINHTAYD